MRLHLRRPAAARGGQAGVCEQRAGAMRRVQRANNAVFHPSGFDLCTKCAAKKAADGQDKDKEAEVVEPPQEEEEEEQEPRDDFVYAGQLVQINQIMALEGGDMDEAINNVG